MRKHILSLIAAIGLSTLNADAQAAKVYDESIDPMTQIDNALSEAKKSDKYVVCQIGGNWCPWCLRFADFIKKDTVVASIVAENFVYIHVNYPRKGAPKELMARLGNPARFGFPVMVVLDGGGNVIHIQDSSFLEEGQTYSSKKVIRFFKCWTPKALKGEE